MSIASYYLTYKWVKELIGPHLKDAIPPKEIIDFHHHPILLNQHLYKRARDTLYNIIRETDSFNDCRFGCYIVGGYHSLRHITKTYWLAIFDEKDKNLINPVYITMNGEILSRFQLKFFKYNPVVYIDTYTHTHNRKLDKKIMDSYEYALSIGIDEVWEEI